MAALIFNFLELLDRISYHSRQMQKSFCILLGVESICMFLEIILEIFLHQH